MQELGRADRILRIARFQRSTRNGAATAWVQPGLSKQRCTEADGDSASRAASLRAPPFTARGAHDWRHERKDAALRTIVIGSLGMLARDLCSVLSARNHAVMGLDLPELDISDRDQVIRSLSRLAPDVVINCAAYTNVDQAESHADLAYAVNRDGALHVAKGCDGIRVPLIHLSTDYVFDGSLGRPYREDDEARPIGVYGQSKLQGENAVRAAAERHYIMRTAWLYGVHGRNFVKTILSHGREKTELRVVADQYGCPTWTMDLAEAICALVERMALGDPAPWGTYHYCGGGITTWHGFAERIIQEGRAREALKVTRVTAITTADYPTAARRPPMSALDCQKIERVLNIRPAPWEDSLKGMMGRLYDSAEPDTR